MRMAVEGMGIVSAVGNGLQDLAQAARHMLREESQTIEFSKIDTSNLVRHASSRALRRVDHFTRMALLAAYSALEDAGLDAAELEHTGIVLATGYGPVKLTFDFLDSIIDFGPEMASPQAFAHSVHNIPAATVALMMTLRGPCFSICQLDTAVAAATLTAQTWLAEKRVTRVLLGAVDEHTALLEINAQRIAENLSAEISGGRRGLAPGEGAVFFCLHADPEHARHGFIENASLSKTYPDAPIFFSGSASPAQRNTLPPMHDFSPLYGNIPIGMAFDATVALLTVQGRLGPVMDECPAVHCLSRNRFGMTGSILVTSREYA
ncbi:3-oxoacyl-[acyl-carrier-protein] synthase II [Desulfomicrobium macestii]|uniref:3-oxoacyl-[acyl-carrier-protein] synthase II n=3 Tax=Desulfomicrobium TaxID=898 RepID=A0A8G2C3Q9_DESNO|nr:beta-ketoacyl synthase N-terminal-like domain-containing protein [Desulfomicrobium macestii]MBE1426597.1 3-oxoacyl-[acyl-carrier-protein] synthase II [Desulfomicrobium macestii]SFL85067.1 3-oxoacyl-[acyl-carrier-protein] synthase II [Desulfomicrobium norvegicum]